jgi:hypothetical protein
MGSFTCRKMLRHGASGFTSHPKEGVLRIFITLKIHRLGGGLNPRPLGSVESTLTATPPRRHLNHSLMSQNVVFAVIPSRISIAAILSRNE